MEYFMLNRLAGFRIKLMCWMLSITTHQLKVEVNSPPTTQCFGSGFDSVSLNGRFI
ncbi:hypothetical protein Hanom_Chr09g00769411 [Helianthus anomalus]